MEAGKKGPATPATSSIPVRQRRRPASSHEHKHFETGCLQLAFAFITGVASPRLKEELAKQQVVLIEMALPEPLP